MATNVLCPIKGDRKLQTSRVTNFPSQKLNQSLHYMQPVVICYTVAISFFKQGELVHLQLL